MKLMSARPQRLCEWAERYSFDLAFLAVVVGLVTFSVLLGMALR